jgi:hypothetical protein
MKLPSLAELLNLLAWLGAIGLFLLLLAGIFVD